MNITPILNTIMVSPYHLTKTTREKYIYPVSNSHGTIEAPPLTMPCCMSIFHCPTDTTVNIIQINNPSELNVPPHIIEKQLAELPDDLYAVCDYAVKKNANFIFIYHEQELLSQFLMYYQNKQNITEKHLVDFLMDENISLRYYDIPDFDNIEPFLDINPI